MIPLLAVSLMLAQAAELAPARPGLPAVPLPPLELLESAVAEQLRAAHEQVEAARRAGAGRRLLGQAYGSLGEVLHAYEFLESAEAAYMNAADLTSGDWRYLLGALYQQTGRLEEAAAQFVAVLRAGPEGREARVHLGELYVQLDRLALAREQFEAVVDTFPAVARNGLGEIALREQRFAEALSHFEEVLRRVPQATAVHYSVAMAYRGLGRLDEARAHLERHGAGTVRAADPILDRVRALVRGERALVLLGRHAYEGGRFREAADAFSRALASAPGSVTARTNLGLVLVLEGRDAEAVEHLRVAFDQAPDDPTVRRELAGALIRLRRDDEAIAVLGRGRAIDPEDEDTVVALAILLADRQRYREALSLLDEANTRFPERTATGTTLARLLASAPDRSLRNGARALDLAMAVYTSSPAPAHAETVALALAELGRCGDASAWMRRAVAEAERLRDEVEAVRLRDELPTYSAGVCRP